jgi:predicted NAD/FAD-dependent oxidoreductase/acyl carrier protein
MFRAPASFTAVHYFSKTAHELLATDGRRLYARFRLRRADLPADGGFVRGDTLLPPDVIPRAPGDDRPPTFLHDELRARVAQGGVDYVLEMQARAPEEAALDCTRPWSEEDHPFRAVARLHLDHEVDAAAIEPLRFNSIHAPADLCPPPAQRATEPASLEALRQVVYEIAASARLGQPLPAALAPLAGDADEPKAAAPAGLRVAVIGAGASGLTAARKLEQLGHRVTVLEAAEEVAGKCRSIEVDGRAFDLGGHLCMPQYTSFAKLVAAVGAEIEDATPTYELDVATRKVIPWDDGPAVREAFLRYRALREGELRDLDRPGFGGVGARLARPAREWLDAHLLAPLGRAIGPSYTSTGYGYLADRGIAALYFVKAAETAGLLAKQGDAGLPPFWTVKGGMGGLWKKVAASLADVRLGVRVGAVERRNGRVVVSVTAGGKRERLEFDRLVLALPLDDALRFLDATVEERELFGEIRYLDYYTIFARAKGLPEEGFYILKQNTDDPARAGHVVALHHRSPGSDVLSFYSYGSEDVDERAVVAKLREDVAGLGGELGEVLLVRKWKYFPHVDPAAIEAGFYDRLEALQGQNGTAYVGSLLNFELIECNVRYAEATVDRVFGDGAARAADRAAEARAARTSAEILAFLVEALGAAGKHADPDTRVEQLGLDSLAVTGLVTRLSDWIGWSVPTTLVYEHRALGRIADALARADEERMRSRAAPAAAVRAEPAEAALPATTRVLGTAEMEALRTDWRATLGVGRWPYEDMFFGCIGRFVRRVILEDAPAFDRAKARGCVYLANHQVASEPALLATLMSCLSGKRMVGLAKIEGRETEFGWLMEHMFAYPGVTYPKTYVYLDRQKPEELGQRVSELAASLAAGESNVLIHVQGTRSTTCREPVKMMNPMFIEMAIATGAPIIPVRLAGGLPVEPLAEKIDFPFGYTKQDYWIGKPLWPEEISALGFGARAERVLEAMNGLGPAHEVEEPGPPDPAFGAAVEAWIANHGAHPIWAVVYNVLAEMRDVSEGSRRIVEGARAGRLVVGTSELEQWLGLLARRFYGPRGPAVVTA